MIKLPSALYAPLLVLLPFLAQAQDLPLQGKVNNIKITRSTLSGQAPEALYLLKTDSGAVPITQDILNNITPEWMESLSVLRDKAAVEKYGEQAKNGVILIGLKKEKEAEVLKSLKNAQPLPETSAAPQKDKARINLYSQKSGTGVQSLYIVKAKTGDITVAPELVSKVDPQWIQTLHVVTGKEAEKQYKAKGKEGVVFITFSPRGKRRPYV
ncbi:hypothetical protein [Rufibacter immobilis]|uniref:hypothetical protein n=1 Tax=Rufibacter immobilis TaxID=1348778 RepID=UPI0035E9F8CE